MGSLHPGMRQRLTIGMRDASRCGGTTKDGERLPLDRHDDPALYGKQRAAR